MRGGPDALRGSMDRGSDARHCNDFVIDSGKPLHGAIDEPGRGRVGLSPCGPPARGDAVPWMQRRSAQAQWLLDGRAIRRPAGSAQTGRFLPEA